MKKKISILLALMMTMMSMNLAACTQNREAVPGSESASANVQATESAIMFEPGTYEGIGTGRNGDIKVEVTVTEDSIESIVVKEHQETPGLSEPALTQLPEEIVEYQSLGVDAVSGATVTSDGLLDAVAAALEQAGANVSALRAVPVNKEVAVAEDLTTQIVVAGGGISGIMAALTAAHQGADVILVEKQGALGGTSITAAGGLVTVDSELAPDDMDDSLERTIEQARLINESSVRQPDYEFLAAILAQTGDAIDYIAEEFGVTPEEFEDRGDYIRSRYGSGRNLIVGLANQLEANGASVLLNTRAEEIVMDGDSAVGLKVSGEGGEYTIYADKVIIATGGASWDMERMLEANPALNTIVFQEGGSAGNTGDGFRMLEEIDANMGEGPYVKPAGARFSVRVGGLSLADVMLIDAEGNRFCNEAPIFSTMTAAFLLRQASPAYYALFDSQRMNEEQMAVMSENAAGDDPRNVIYGETLDELADKLQIPAEKLRATFDRYQELCANGTDADFAKDASHLIPYAEDGGFYAAHVSAGSFGTFGGAITDEQFRVLREDGSVINNVFAVGECANSKFYGDYYYGAFSLGLYSAAGKIAGETAAEEIYYE